MYFFDELDYYTLKDSVDVISWDAYPTWGENEESEAEVARRFAEENRRKQTPSVPLHEETRKGRDGQ